MNTLRAFNLTLTLAFFSALTAAAQAPATKQHPVPDAASIAAGKKLIGEVYRAEYAKATTPPLKQALAKKLIEDGAKTNDDQAAQYSLFLVARRIAVEIGDLDLAMQTVELTGKSFVVDVGAMQQEAIEDIAPQVKTPEDNYALTRHIGRLLQPHLQADRYEAADKLIESALAAAKKSKDADLLKQWTRRAKEVAANEAAFVATKAARVTLAREPADEAANATVGKYACFVKNDWEKGLSMLALGDDVDLQKLAEQDLKGANKAAEQLALADAWYALAQQREAAEKTALLRRARTLYQRALPSLTALPKRRVENRLQEIRAATSPFVKDEWVEILDLVDLSKHRLEGEWRRQGIGYLGVNDGDACRLAIPVIVDGSYELQIRGTRLQGVDTLTVGLSQVVNGTAFGLNTWFGECSGLYHVNGKIAKENGTAIPPFPLANGEPYVLALAVNRREDKVDIAARVNAKPYFRWAGSFNTLSAEQEPRLYLGSWKARVEIESVQLKLKSGAAWLTE